MDGDVSADGTLGAPDKRPRNVDELVERVAGEEGKGADVRH